RRKSSPSSCEEPPFQCDVDADADCDGRPDNDSHSCESYKRVDPGHDEMDAAGDISHKAHYGEPRRPPLPGQKKGTADNRKSPDGGAFIDEDSAVGFGDAYVVTEEETRKYLCDTEENHSRGNDCNSSRPTLLSAVQKVTTFFAA